MSDLRNHQRYNPLFTSLLRWKWTFSCLSILAWAFHGSEQLLQKFQAVYWIVSYCNPVAVSRNSWTITVFFQSNMEIYVIYSVVRVLVLEGTVLYFGLSSGDYIQFILFNIYLMQDINALLRSKTFAEQSAQYSVTDSGFLKCSFSDPIYRFPHN